MSARELIGKSATSSNPWGDITDKFNDRSKELISKYKVARGSKYSLAIKLRLNLDVEKQPQPESIVDPVVVDPKKKK